MEEDIKRLEQGELPANASINERIQRRMAELAQQEEQEAENPG
jgi:hypothetical protein